MAVECAGPGVSEILGDDRDSKGMKRQLLISVGTHKETNCESICVIDAALPENPTVAITGRADVNDKHFVQSVRDATAIAVLLEAIESPEWSDIKDMIAGQAAIVLAELRKNEHPIRKTEENAG